MKGLCGEHFAARVRIRLCFACARRRGALECAPCGSRHLSRTPGTPDRAVSSGRRERHGVSHRGQPARGFAAKAAPRSLVAELVKRMAAVDLARHMRTEIERWSR